MAQDREDLPPIVLPADGRQRAGARGALRARAGRARLPSGGRGGGGDSWFVRSLAPVSLGLLASGALVMARAALTGPLPLAIFLLSLSLLRRTELSVGAVMLVAGLAGFALGS